jgi:hypothetical protein
LAFDGVSLSVPFRREGFLDRCRKRVNLLRDERSQLGWGRSLVFSGRPGYRK